MSESPREEPAGDSASALAQIPTQIIPHVCPHVGPHVPTPFPRRGPLIPKPPVPIDVIWRALADPTRRTIIDLLYQEEGITQQIVERVAALDRCTIMKHLRILERAEIVRSGRDGRVRLHWLRLAPLHRIHEEWLGFYVAEHEYREAQRRARV